MTAPPPVLGQCDGTELLRVLCGGGLWRWLPARLLRRPRIEIVSAVAGPVVFATAFDAAPLVFGGQALVNGQAVLAFPRAVTATGFTLDVMRSRGTLALSAGPFEAAAGVAVPVLVVGN